MWLEVVWGGHVEVLRERVTHPSTVYYYYLIIQVHSPTFEQKSVSGSLNFEG